MKSTLVGLLVLVGLTTTLVGCGLPGGNSPKTEQSEESEADARTGEEQNNKSDDDDDDDEKSKENRSNQEKDGDD